MDELTRPTTKPRRTWVNSRDGLVLAAAVLLAVLFAAAWSPVSRLAHWSTGTGDWFPIDILLPLLVFLIGLLVFATLRPGQHDSVKETDERGELEQFHLATHDPLTKLPNRLLFVDRLNRATAWGLRRDSLVAILLVEVDADRLSDVQGEIETMMATVARRLQSSVRDVDTAAYLGDNRFALLLEGIGIASEAGIVAQRTLDILAAPVPIDTRSFGLTTHIGISISTPVRYRPEELLRDAEFALEHAKRGPTNRFTVYDPDLTDDDEVDDRSEDQVQSSQLISNAGGGQPS